MVTATYDENGRITGYYPDGIAYDEIPSPSVRIDDETHVDAYTHPGKYRVVNGELVAGEVPEDPNAAILMQIAALEATQTPRLYREAALGSTVVNPATGRTAAQQLQHIEEEIETLRGQLV